MRTDSNLGNRDSDAPKDFLEPRSLKFNSARTKQLFDFLIESFVEDYMRKKYVQERSGWRSLVEAAHGIDLPLSAMYGKSGGQSAFVNELIRQGLIEMRIFPGERGRGGETSKLRIAYEKKPVQAAVEKIVWGDVPDEDVRPMDKLTVAVLPFVNISSDPADEYISDGMTEELISTISRISGLRVISRTSVMQYKSALKNMEHIGRELGAGSVIEGSVRKAGNLVRVSVQLVDASADNHLWAQIYDGELRDIFSIQIAIAEKVASALKVTLLEVDRKKLARAPTTDPEAHALYLKGRACYLKATGEAIVEAIECFQMAIEKDPHYALAYAWLSTIEFSMGASGRATPEESFKRGEELARRALSLDESLPEAHLALANGLFLNWNFKSAETELRRSLELEPNSPLGMYLMSGVMKLRGRNNEAVRLALRAMELDPVSPETIHFAASVLLYSGRTDDAIVLYRKLLKIDPEYALARGELGIAYLQKGMLDQGIDSIREGIKLEKGFTSGRAGDLAYALSKAGRFAEVREVLADALEWHEKTHLGAMLLASIYANLGEKDKAFEWLEKGFQEHSSYFPFVVFDFVYDNLRSDPRMKPLIDRLGLA